MHFKVMLGLDFCEILEVGMVRKRSCGRGFVEGILRGEGRHFG